MFDASAFCVTLDIIFTLDDSTNEIGKNLDTLAAGLEEIVASDLELGDFAEQQAEKTLALEAALANLAEQAVEVVNDSSYAWDRAPPGPSGSPESVSSLCALRSKDSGAANIRFSLLTEEAESDNVADPVDAAAAVEADQPEVHP